MVDFLCSHSAVRLLPYRDATERRGSGQREEKRRTNKTPFSSLNLLTSESVPEIVVKPSLFYFVGMCAYTQLYVSEPCALSRFVCTCFCEAKEERENEKSKQKV